jgi:hypothetical protein
VILNESIVAALREIECEAVHASEHIDLGLLRDRSAGYIDRSAKRKELRQRRDAIREQVNDSVLWTIYSSIARAEAEAIEWRAMLSALEAKRGAQLSLDVDAASDDALRRPTTTDGETRRR